ncbi:putative ribonuclease H-like domain-containing protein [Tanacetum coccineum]
MNLRFLEDKPNVQGIGHEWYFDLDYLTDSLGYTHFKTDKTAGTQETNINAGTQDHDSDSEVDEQVIVVPSFPSNRFAGPSSSNGPSIMERNADYAEELATLQRQEYEAKDAAARYGYLFSQATAEILCQAEAEIRNQGVSAVTDPAGIDSAVREPAGIVSADGVSTGSPSADSDPAGSNPVEPTDESNPAVSSSVSAEFNPVYADESTLPPGQQLGSSENTTRFPVPSDVCMDQISSGIFTSSSYDDDFRATLTNLAPAVEVNPVPTKRVNTIHPQSQILGDLASPVMTRSRAQKSKFGESAFIGYIQDQQRTNHTDQLHCLSACFLSQLEPTSIAKALEDPDWVDAMQKRCTIHQSASMETCPLLMATCNRDKLIWKNKRMPELVNDKARWFAQDTDKRERALITMSAFLYGEIEEEVYVTQPKGFEDPYFPKHVYRVVKALYGLHQAPRPVYVDDIIFGSTNKAWCDEFEVLMKGEFEMSAMGEMTFFLVRCMFQTSSYSTDFSSECVKKNLQCKKQTIVATSSTEAEYVAAASCCAQVLWIQNQLLDYGFNFMNTKIFIDNQSTICIVKNPVFHQRTKHIEIRHHFIRDANEKNLIQVLKIHTDDNVADLLTKAFDGPRFAYLVVHIGMVDMMLVSAGCTMVLLVVILPAGRMVSAGWSMVLLVVIFPAARLVSAGCTMVLLVVIFPAGRLVSAGCTMVLLVVIFPAGRLVSAGCTMVLLSAVILPAGRMVSAVGSMFLLVDIVSCGRLVSAVYYGSAGKLYISVLICFQLVVLWSARSYCSLLDSLFLLEAMGYLRHLDSADRNPILIGVTMYLLLTLVCCTPVTKMITTESLTWGGKRFRGLHRYPQLLGPLSIESAHICWSHDLVATIDGREVVVTESLIRAQLQLDDANGIFDMQIDDIFAGMGAIGYPPGRTLTFLKHHLSPQWRFLVHTILHCLSPKAGSWNQFPSSIATALICLSTGRVYNFSRFILEGMIANVKATRHKFLMYPRFLQMLVAIETADRTPRPTFGFTRKLFSNMKLKWEGEAISLTPPMLAIAAAGNDAADEETVPAHAVAGSPAEAHPVPHPPPFSPVRETTPERQPETEWVVPNPVSPGTDWRPWPSVLAPRPPTPPAQTLSLEEPLVFGPVPKPAGYVDPDSIDPIIFGPPPRPYDFVDPALEESVIFGPLPRPANYIEPEDITNLNSMEDETILVIGRMIIETDWEPQRNHGGSILTLPGSRSSYCTSEDIEEREEERFTLGFICSSFSYVLPHADISESAGPSVGADKGKAPMPDLEIPAEFLAEDAQARQRLEEEQASARLVQQLQAEDLAQADVPLVSEQRAKELDELLLRMTDTDWLTLMMQVGTNPALARELLGADVNEDNFIERMTAIKERKKRALADLRYRALKGKPLKQSEVTKMMRNLVKNQWCAAHNGTITMKAVTAMSKQQLTEEYENICRRLEKDHLLSAQYNLFRPKPAITEPPSKRQRVERASSQPSDVPAATTQPADDPDSAGGSSFHPAGSTPMSGSAVPDTAGGTLGTTGTASTVPTSAAMDSPASHRELGISPFADSDESSSPSPVSTDHIPIDVLFEPTPGGIHAFFLDSDEDEQIGLSRVATEPDSDDEVLAEILFRGQYVSGAGVVVVDKLPDDEIVDPRVKVEPISESASSPPRSRSKHRGVRSDTSLWDRPVDDFLSSESESDDDIEDYIPPIPYGAFKDWEIVRCPLRNTYYHVYYQENRRHKNFFYLKELLPHVYREDLLLLRRRMNRYFRLNPDVDVGLDLWRDVNLLCQSLHSDDVEDFWRTQETGVVKQLEIVQYLSGLHSLEGCSHQGFTVPPHTVGCMWCWNDIQTIRWLAGILRCLASAPIACTARQMVFNSPWLTAEKEFGSPLQTALVCNSNPLIALGIPAKTSIRVVPADSSSNVPADYVSAGHVLVPADRDRIC